jgi:predicted transcriptional regulator of viral defense system
VSATLEERIRGEFLEMPDLRLTPQQASRLWAVDRTTSEVVLIRLTSRGFLSRTREGAYLRSSAA